MGSVYTIETLRSMIGAAVEAVNEHCSELSKLDSLTGDGDHGTAICQAMKAAYDSLDQATELQPALSDLGLAVMTKSCGSTSTLIGALFIGMSGGVAGDELSPAEVSAMFASGLANVRQQTKADIGDKTMMDALIPAVAALEKNQEQGVAAMFAAAADEAFAGARKTVDMAAKFGRARNLGDRVIGCADAGATSMAYMFKAFAEVL